MMKMEKTYIYKRSGGVERKGSIKTWKTIQNT
ncbi:hypothetical protein ISN45_At01g055990, partial [Arabidopsis thaliana x Arabidopsis arenosa]